MKKYFCDLCGQEQNRLFLDREYYISKESGPTLTVTIRVKQGDLCEDCARKVAYEGKGSQAGNY